MQEHDEKLRDLVAEVAAGYFSNSHVGVGEIPSVISQIAASLSGIGVAAEEPETPSEAPRARLTAAQVRRSITPEALISFEDGKPYKTLKRHLSTRGLSIAQYAEKWGLPKDYPTVATAYSARRSELAKTLGLGQKGATRKSKSAAKPAAKSASPRGRKAVASA